MADKKKVQRAKELKKKRGDKEGGMKYELEALREKWQKMHENLEFGTFEVKEEIKKLREEMQKQGFNPSEKAINTFRKRLEQGEVPRKTAEGEIKVQKEKEKMDKKKRLDLVKKRENRFEEEGDYKAAAFQAKIRSDIFKKIGEKEKAEQAKEKRKKLQEKAEKM